jgi:GDP-D-mannose dehydratase
MNWKDFIIQTNKLKRPQEIREVKVNTKLTQNKIGWKAKTDGKKVILKLIKYYLKKK